MSAEKILDLADLAARSRHLRAEGKSVVLCHGTFDLMHTGHIRYLQRAKQEGDVLLVTITADAFVNKGPGRPVFNEHLRAESLAALGCVDFVAINHAVSAVEALHEIQPSIYAKGSDYRSHNEDVTGNIAREQAAVEAHGGHIFYTDEITFSSSNLLNSHFDVFPPDVKDFLREFRDAWPEKDVRQMIASLSDLKVLVVGDAIIDQFPDAPTVTKRRFVDADLAKFFEVYFYKDNAVSGDLEKEICQWLEKNIEAYDAVVVPDFGNGFITSAMIEILSRKAKFLAVNPQINSGNRGYHVINRYPRADFVSLNEPEIRLAAHNRSDSLEAVVGLVGERVNVKQLAVTRGTKGVMMYDRSAKMFHQVPALATRVIDRIGAGDAFLSLAGLCVAKGLDAKVAAFVGSVAAAMDVQIVCNREPINPAGLNKYISTLLK